MAFARVVETVLSRDKNWVRWKEENCPEISRPAVSPALSSQAMDSAKSLWTWKRLRATPLGSLDLSFLTRSEHDGGVNELSDPHR
jgi:THO complex subunit 1